MRLLKLKINGLQLFEKELELDFYAQQRVSAEKNEMLSKAFSNIYLNNIISLIGINASGKTTVLMVISFVLNLLNNEPINNIRTKKILNGIENDETITIESFFYSEPNNMCKLKTVIGLNTLAKNEEKKFKIVEEKLWVKSTDTIKIKKTLFEFDEHPMHERNHQEEFLLDDVSIMVAVNKKIIITFM